VIPNPCIKRWTYPGPSPACGHADVGSFTNEEALQTKAAYGVYGPLPNARPTSVDIVLKQRPCGATEMCILDHTTIVKGLIFYRCPFLTLDFLSPNLPAISESPQPRQKYIRGWVPG